MFRHFDSASVVKGFFRQPPKSAWVMHDLSAYTTY
ncbi:fatty acid cis/trans isomerase [Colwellia sp. MB02u-11]